MMQVTAMCEEFLLSGTDSEDRLCPGSSGQNTNYGASTIQRRVAQLVSQHANLDSKSKLQPLSGVSTCGELAEDGDEGEVGRERRKRKRGRRRMEWNKQRKEQTGKRSHKRNMTRAASDQETITESEGTTMIQNDGNLLSDPEDDLGEEWQSSRSCHGYTSRRVVSTARSPTLPRRRGIHARCRQKNREARWNQGTHRKPLDTGFCQTPAVSSSLVIEKLTFSDLKCSVCHELFVHYSTKVLHQKTHHRKRLQWLGKLQKRYMACYVRQYFDMHCQTDQVHPLAERVNISDVNTMQRDDQLHSEQSREEKRFTKNSAVDANNHVAETDISAEKVCVLNTPIKWSSENEVVSHFKTGSSETPTHDTEQMNGLLMKAVLPPGDCGVKMEDVNFVCGSHMCDDDRCNGTAGCAGQGSLHEESEKQIDPSDRNSQQTASNLKYMTADGASFSQNILNVIKSENHLKADWNKVGTSDGTIINCKSQHLKESVNKTLKSKGKTKFIVLGNISQCVCKLCDMKLPFSLRLLHLVQRHGFIRRCKTCGLVFFHPSSSIFHKVRVHKAGVRIKSTKTHTCAGCGKQFIFKKTLKWHAAHFHGCDPDRGAEPDVGVSGSLICRHCHCAFKYHRALLVHLPMHGLSRDELRLELTSPSCIAVRPRINNCKPGEPKTCPVCSRRFRALTTLRQHMNQMHDVPVTKVYIMEMKNMAVKKVQCQEDDCMFMAMTVHELEHHMHACHPTVSYECHYCRYKTVMRKRMDKHIRLNHVAGKTCEVCGKQFHKHYHLKHHSYKVHNIIDPTIKLYKCPHEGCDYSSLTMYTLDVHMQKHNTDKPYKCPECGRMLKTEKNLEKHMNKIHRGIRPYICDQCGASYGEESELKTHMARHSEAKKYHCMYCDYTTQEKGNFQSHLWARHKVKLHEKQTVFECQMCSYTTDRKTRFTQHVASHNNIRNFKCPHCEKTFVAKNTMTSHIKWMHMDKSMACDYCNHKTSTLNMLREHVRMMHTHRDVKPYQCAYCEYRCRTSGNCRKHCMNKHKEQPVKWIKVCDKYPNNDRPVLSMEQASRENGLLRKDSRTKRIFAYEPEEEASPAGEKQKEVDMQQEIVAQQEVSLLQQRLSSVPTVIVSSTQVQPPLQAVLTTMLQNQHLQIVQPPHEPVQQQQEQQQAPQHQPIAQPLQEQPGTLHQQYLSPLILNPSLQQQQQQQQQQLLLMMQQQQSFKNQ